MKARIVLSVIGEFIEEHNISQHGSDSVGFYDRSPPFDYYGFSSRVHRRAIRSSQGLFVTWQIILVLLYRGIYIVFTGFLVSKLAPHRPMMHALILACIGVVLTLLATTDPEIARKAPLWFPYTLAAITLPCTWLGVKIVLSWNVGVERQEKSG